MITARADPAPNGPVPLARADSDSYDTGRSKYDHKVLTSWVHSTQSTHPDVLLGRISYHHYIPQVGRSANISCHPQVRVKSVSSQSVSQLVSVRACVWCVGRYQTLEFYLSIVFQQSIWFWSQTATCGENLPMVSTRTCERHLVF